MPTSTLSTLSSSPPPPPLSPARIHSHTIALYTWQTLLICSPFQCLKQIISAHSPFLALSEFLCVYKRVLQHADVFSTNQNNSVTWRRSFSSSSHRFYARFCSLSGRTTRCLLFLQSMHPSNCCKWFQRMAFFGFFSKGITNAARFFLSQIIYPYKF